MKDRRRGFNCNEISLYLNPKGKKVIDGKYLPTFLSEVIDIYLGT